MQLMIRNLVGYFYDGVKSFPISGPRLFLTLLLVLFIYFGSFSAILFVVGICAALIANSTAAGGGVLFVPVFSHLDMTDEVVVGTSILIQCFGMTAGAIRWTMRMKESNQYFFEFKSNLKKFILPTIVGVFIGIYLKSMISINLELAFSLMSITFASFLLLQTWMHANGKSLVNLSGSTQNLSCQKFALIGGALTPFISVGVGELVAIVMMIMGRGILVSVATGVTLASISLLFTMPSVILTGHYDKSVLLFVAPGALIGGLVAYKITEFLGPTKLKLFFSLYVIVVSLVMFNKACQ